MSTAWDSRNVNPSTHEIQELKQRLLDHIDGMNAEELRIATKSKDSFLYYVSEVARTLSEMAGFAIAIPIAFIANLTETVLEGIGDGFKRGWESGYSQIRDRR